MTRRPWFWPAVALASAAALLLAVTLLTADITRQRARQQHLALLQTLLPGSTEFTLVPYTGSDDGIRSVHQGQTGQVVEVSVQGYVDEVTVLVGVSSEGEVLGLMVLSAHETPGLGDRILSDTDFLCQFLHTTGQAQVGEDVMPITGATVSSRAVERCVNAAVAVATGTGDVTTEATVWEE